MKKIFLVPLVLFLLGAKDECGHPVPQGAAESANISETAKDFAAIFMFEYEGCRIYRFEDSGKYIYWTKCKDDKSETMWQQSCGDDCETPMNVR